MRKSLTKSYDILGISSATLCIIHCIVFPILTIIPFGFSDNAFIDLLFAYIGMFVVLKVLMSHATKKVKYILGISILIIITSVLLEVFLRWHSGLILIGGLGMIIGHFLNFKDHDKTNAKSI